jgi:hypothetical protein
MADGSTAQLPPLVCPHCDGVDVHPMRLRHHEAESQVTWYECRDCKRMWSIPKDGRDARRQGGR